MSEWKAPLRRGLSVFALFVLLAALWFFKEAFGGNLFCFGDLTYYFYPYRWFLAQSVHQGALPLWNPLIQMGFPFLATLQSGTFYPLSVLYYILPFDLAFNWFLIVHYPLGGFFMYLLGRELRMSPLAAAGAGLVFAFSGYLSSVLHMPTTLASVIWLPLVMLFWRRIVQGPRIHSQVPILAVLLAIMFLGGEPTVLYGTICSMLVYLVYARKPRGVLWLAAALGLAAGLTAVQLLPFAELIWHSVRAGGIPFSEAAKFSVPLHKMIDLVFPYFSSVRWYPWLDSGWLKVTYLGIVPAWLALIALFFLPARQKWWLTASLFIILLIMAGAYSPLPLYQMLYSAVPGFGLFRYPAKFAFLLVFIFAYLSGRGVDLAAARLPRLKLAWLAVAAAALLFLFSLIDPGPFYFFLKSLLASRVAAGESGLISSITLPRDVVNLGLLAGLSALLFIWLESARRREWPAGVVRAGLVGLVLIDLYTANSAANFSVASVEYHVAPPNVRLLMNDKSAFRYFIAPDAYLKCYADDLREFDDWGRALSSLRNRLTYDQNMIFGLAGLDGYESIKGADHDRIGKKLLALDSLEGVRALDLFNVKYLVTANPFRQAGYRLLTVNPEEFKGGSIYLYENLNVLPRSFYVPKARVVSRDEALGLIFSRGFEPRREVLLEEKVDSPAGFRFTSEWFYPGWKAFIDGKEAKIYRANYMFRAVALPRPDSKVTYVYDPLSFKLGALISLLCLAGALAIMLLRRR